MVHDPIPDFFGATNITFFVSITCQHGYLIDCPLLVTYLRDWEFLISASVASSQCVIFPERELWVEINSQWGRRGESWRSSFGGGEVVQIMNSVITVTVTISVVVVVTTVVITMVVILMVVMMSLVIVKICRDSGHNDGRGSGSDGGYSSSCDGGYRSSRYRDGRDGRHRDSGRDSRYGDEPCVTHNYHFK